MPSKAKPSAPKQQMLPRDRLMAYAQKTIAKTRGWEGELIKDNDMTKRLGITLSELKALQNGNKVIAFRHMRDGHLYPAEQVDDGRLVPALDQLISIIGTQSETWRWLCQPCTDLAEIRPVDRLKQGHVDVVVAVAHLQYDLS